MKTQEEIQLICDEAAKQAFRDEKRKIESIIQGRMNKILAKDDLEFRNLYINWNMEDFSLDINFK